ncbi:MAG: helix-turn-helix domain-containing protein [Alphaproteobacteria bacterium]|nr:helix-turn-helix domain-containing protein [Alphaproteobacteria bacterium]
MTYTQPLTHETLLTVHELANLLKIKPDTIYHWHLRKAYPEIKRVKIAGKVYFKLSSLQPFLNIDTP